MTEDITSLQIRINYDQIAEAERRLRALGRTNINIGAGMRAQDSGMKSLTKTIVGLAGAYLGLNTAVSGFRAIIRTTAEFQKLNAQLTTALGSAEKAKAAFEVLKDFAEETPFTLDQSVQAFAKMTNFGLEASVRMLRSFGNTAAATGRTVDQMVEATADAVNGQYKRLLDAFNIQADKQKDKLFFSFRGVKTEVGNNAKAITEYLTKIGENKFGDAMALQMNTLGGKFSNLEDAWKRLLNEIGENGLGQAVSDSVDQAIAALTELRDELESGQMQELIAAQTIQWKALGSTIEDMFSDAGYAMSYFVDDSRTSADDWDEIWRSIFLNMPASLNESLKISLAYVQWFVTSSSEMLGTLERQASNFGKSLGAKAAANWEWLKGNGSVQGNLDKIARGMAEKQARETGVGPLAGGAPDDSGPRADDVLKDRISDIRAETNELMKNSEQRRDNAEANRTWYDLAKYGRSLNKKANEEAITVKANGGGNMSDPAGGKGGRKRGGGASEFETLEKTLRNSEDLIAESYQRRFELIEANTRDGSKYQAELEISLTDKFEEEQLKRLDMLKNQGMTTLESYAAEEQILKDSYERRKDIILNATELTEEEKKRMLEESNRRQAASHLDQLVEEWSDAEKIVGGGLQNLAEVSKSFGKRGFAAYKAFSMAEATITGIRATLSAFADGNKWGGPIVGAAFAATAAAASGAQIASIAKQEYAGAYAIGGAIPAGKVGLVGEAGPELVKGPAMVTSAQSTWDRRGGAQSEGGGSNVEITIINNTGEKVTETSKRDGNKEMIQFVIGQAADRVAGDIKKGGTGVAKAIESTYNLGRGRRA